MLVVIAGFGTQAMRPRRCLQGLRRVARSARACGGVEAGTWLVGRAGLLEGRAATTHWEDMEDFAAAFPGADVRPDRYVIDGPVFTTGGASPTFDLMLHLIRSRLGMAVALDVASVFIYDQARAATDAQPLVSLGRLDGYDPRLAQAIRLMEAHVDQPLTIAAIARRAGVTPRTLESIFRKSIGETPGAYYLRLRLNAARRLVVDTRVRMADIAARTGFSSARSVLAGVFANASARRRPRCGRAECASRRSGGVRGFVGLAIDQARIVSGKPALEPARHGRVPFRRGVARRPASGIAIRRSTIDADSWMRSSSAPICASKPLCGIVFVRFVSMRRT